MHEFDTRAVFIEGPIHGKVMMLQHRPSIYTVAQLPRIPCVPTADFDWPVHHIYRRNDVWFMDGDLIAYEYVGVDASMTDWTIT